MEIINEQVLIGEQMTHVVVAEVKYFDTWCPRCERFESVQRPELVVAQLYGLQLWYVVSDDLYDLNRIILSYQHCDIICHISSAMIMKIFENST